MSATEHKANMVLVPFAFRRSFRRVKTDRRTTASGYELCVSGSGRANVAGPKQGLDLVVCVSRFD